MTLLRNEPRPIAKYIRCSRHGLSHFFASNNVIAEGVAEQLATLEDWAVEVTMLFPEFIISGKALNHCIEDMLQPSCFLHDSGQASLGRPGQLFNTGSVGGSQLIPQVGPLVRIQLFPQAGTNTGLWGPGQAEVVEHLDATVIHHHAVGATSAQQGPRRCANSTPSVLLAISWAVLSTNMHWSFPTIEHALHSDSLAL